MRLNKYIAQSGYCSRRAADQLIVSGRVSVNGVIVDALGSVINPIKDKVKVEGNKIQIPLAKTYIAFYKPRGILSSMSEEKDSLLPWVESMKTPGLFHVGRLDQESEGLLLLSNDGDWANQISHPSYGVEKEYDLQLDRDLRADDLSQLTSGVPLEDGLFRADAVKSLGERRVRLVIHDGRNRVLRRVFEELGYGMIGLKRTRIGRITLGRMRPGEWKEIESSSI
jgi:23S rRNA pseudouridine2605 synthase